MGAVPPGRRLFCIRYKGKTVMKPVNNPDLAVAQEWFERLRTWLAQQDIDHALGESHKVPPPYRGYLAYCLFARKQRESDERRRSLPVLQAYLAEGNILVQDITEETVYAQDAAEHIAALLAFVDELLENAKRSRLRKNTALPGVPVLLAVWEALLAAMEQDTTQNAHCQEAITQLGEHVLGGTDPAYCKDNPLTALQIAAMLAKSAEFAPSTTSFDAQVEQQVGEYMPANADILFKARNKQQQPPALCVELKALEALHTVSRVYPELVSNETMRTEIRALQKHMPKNGVPVLLGSKGPVSLKDAVETILVFSKLSHHYGELRNKAIPPLRWASFYLQAPKTGAPYAYRYAIRSVGKPAPIHDCARLYLALATYLRYHYSKLSRSLGNAYEG